MSEFRDEALVQAALDMALARRHLNPELIHHTDQGSRDAADDYRATLRSKPILISMSKQGGLLDNAMLESFFGTLRGVNGITALSHPPPSLDSLVRIHSPEFPFCFVGFSSLPSR